MSQLSANQLTKLGKIVEATTSEPGYEHMSTKSVQILLDAGLVECNTEMTDAQGNPAVRATQQGIDTMNTPAPETAAEAPATPQFERRKIIGLPKISRAGAASSKYPFDDLEAPYTDENGDVVYDSFFVSATENMPNPGKSLASTVSSASKRYATENGTRKINRKNKETGEMEPVEVTAYKYERKFIVRSADGGAEVIRVNPDE